MMFSIFISSRINFCLNQTRGNKFTCLPTQFCLSVVGFLLVPSYLAWTTEVSCGNTARVAGVLSCVRAKFVAVSLSMAAGESLKTNVRLSPNPAIFHDVTQC